MFMCVLCMVAVTVETFMSTIAKVEKSIMVIYCLQPAKNSMSVVPIIVPCIVCVLARAVHNSQAVAIIVQSSDLHVHCTCTCTRVLSVGIVLGLHDCRVANQLHSSSTCYMQLNYARLFIYLNYVVYFFPPGVQCEGIVLGLHNCSFCFYLQQPHGCP